MPNTAPSSPPYAAYLRDVLGCLRKDLTKIIAVTILAVAAAAAVGKLTNTATSTAQLVLTPIPLQERKADDALAVMLASELDVTTVSLLCKSDTVLRKTMEKLNASGELGEPIEYVNQLQNALDHRVTVSKETPYDLVYSPIVELTAYAKKPADARLMVNTWAEIVVAAAKEFQDAVQKPAAKALRARTEELKKDLVKAEMESEMFWTKSNVLYLEERLTDIIARINSLKHSETVLGTQLIAERASLEVINEELAAETEKLSLRWIPSAGLAAALSNVAGVSAENRSEDAGKTQSLIEIEHLNTVHWELRGRAAATHATVASLESQLRELDPRVGKLEAERLEVQAELAKKNTEKNRVGRKLERVEGAYSNLADKNAYARVAEMLNYPALQIISHGTEWRLPRFRRAIIFGVIAAVMTCGAAVFLSIAYRMVLKPALDN